MSITRENTELDHSGPPVSPMRRWAVPLTVAAVVLAAAGVVGYRMVADDTVSTPDVQPSASAPASTPAGTPALDRSTIVWPFTDSGYADPVALAADFATTYLGFTAPVTGTLRQGDARSGEVEVRPRANGPATTVLVRQVTGDSRWFAIGAATGHVEVSTPEALATVTSPLRIAGRALAFEGTVQVEVREDGSTTPLGKGFVTGGGSEMGPFADEIAFQRPTGRYGTVVLYTTSAEDGRVWEAAVLRVAFS